MSTMPHTHMQQAEPTIIQPQPYRARFQVRLLLVLVRNDEFHPPVHAYR